MSSQNEAHGDEDLVDVTDAHLEQALEVVVETVMLFGCYPQPNRAGLPTRRVVFDLSDFIAENMDVGLLSEWITGCITSFGVDRSINVDRYTDELQAMVTKYFDGSEIVADLAGEYALEEAQA